MHLEKFQETAGHVKPEYLVTILAGIGLAPTVCRPFCRLRLKGDHEIYSKDYLTKHLLKPPLMPRQYDVQSLSLLDC